MGPGSIAASVRSVFSESKSSLFNNSQRSKSNSVRTLSVHSHAESDADSDSDSESVFIYSRISRLPLTFFRKDEVSNCYVHRLLQVFTTHTGIVHLCLPDNTPIRTVRVHRSSVLDIDVDPLGEFVATASIDGTVVIASVADPQDTSQASFKRPIHAIALHPEYRTARTYISGGTAGQILLSERGWLKSRSDTVLAQTGSTILALMWTPWGLLWCNEDGITFFDLDSRVKKLQIERPSQALRADLFKPRLTRCKLHLVVAWARSVYVIDLPSAKLVYQLNLAYTIAGAVPFRADDRGLPTQFAVLVADELEPELKLLDARRGIESYADELQMNTEGRRLGVNDYHLMLPSEDENWKELVKISKVNGKHKEKQKLQEDQEPPGKSEASGKTESIANTSKQNHKEKPSKQDNKIWIVSCLDAVVARERNARDHLDWLIESGKYADAFQAAKQLDIKNGDDPDEKTADFDPGEYRDIGLKAAQQLLDSQHFERASLILSEILSPSEDHAEWLMWSNQFFGAGKHLIWGDVLPGTELGGNIYDTVLEAAVNARDSSRLSTWIHNWPLDTYDAPSLATKLDNAIKADNSESQARLLRLVYADILLSLREYVGAVQALVQADSQRAFRITSHYHLWNEPQILEILGGILEAGQGELGDGGYVGRLRELIDCRAEISPLKVVHQLQSEKDHSMLLFGYLTELGLVDETLLAEKPLVDLMIPLFARYDRGKLLGFLEKFDTYDIDICIDLCRQLHLINELVYLLGRLGKAKEALELIVIHLRDYHRAVLFARSRNGDPEIWDQIIGYAGESPGLVLELLKCVEVSPARVLAAVPDSLRIPGLKDALCQVINGQEVSVALHEGALSIVNTESRRWTQALRTSRKLGISLDSEELASQLESQSEANWHNVPVLVSEKDNKPVVQRVDKSRVDTSTLTGKLKHLRWILSQQP